MSPLICLPVLHCFSLKGLGENGGESCSFQSSPNFPEQMFRLERSLLVLLEHCWEAERSRERLRVSSSPQLKRLKEQLTKIKKTNCKEKWRRKLSNLKK
ncbi:uncharacterized protein [Euphorbia lathyris]|uniref:uncharacterized protein isoform X3 n=1 Tax=Euphorbia lathyris TaxID=212925 RepID=UPI0033140CEE